jgi:uncharacterized protein YjbJ (UPF0337 family)
MAFPLSRRTPAINATTLVLAARDGGMRPGIELRFLHGLRSARRPRSTPMEVHTMSIEEQAKGKLDEAKGRGKQAQGDLTGDDSKKAEGAFDEAKGKARQAGDKAREAINDLTK